MGLARRGGLQLLGNANDARGYSLISVWLHSDGAGRCDPLGLVFCREIATSVICGTGTGVWSSFRLVCALMSGRV